MKRVPVWLVLPAITSLFIVSATAACAAAGDTVQTTGGGWIVPSVPTVTTPTSTFTAGALVPAADNNTKATFGFVASATVQADGSLGDFQGELSYHDHGVELKLHSLSVTQVSVIDAQTLSFAGTADVETSAGAVPADFVVTVHDAGEPGIGVDSFDIQLLNFTLPGDSAPYHRFGLLGGGNIQVR